MRALDVVFSVSGLWRNSGVTEVVLRGANALAAAGYEVGVVSWSTDQPVSGSDWDPRVRLDVTPAPATPWAQYRVFSDRLRALVADHPQPSRLIIHGHGLWLPSDAATASVARRLGARFWLSPHGMLEPWAFKHRRWKKALAWTLYQRRQARQCVALHACSTQEAAALSALLPGHPVVKVPLGVQDLGPHSAPSARQVLFLSRIHPKKGLDMLIDAWHQLSPPDWRLLIAGPDEVGHTAQLRARIDRLDLGSSVELRGALNGEDKLRAMDGSSLFVLPSRSENFGLVVAEALMAGLPVLTTSATPWLDLAYRGCGWTAEATPDGIREALRQALAATPSQLAQMGDAGRRWMQAEFTWTAFAEGLARAYHLGSATSDD